MERVTENRVRILLMDRGGSKIKVKAWLTDNGYLTWEASDLSHVMDELSDFTVMRRPDVVMLEVNSIGESFDALQDALESVWETSDVTVIGLSEQIGTSAPAPRRNLASNMEQLKSIMRPERPRRDFAVA